MMTVVTYRPSSTRSPKNPRGGGRAGGVVPPTLTLRSSRSRSPAPTQAVGRSTSLSAASRTTSTWCTARAGPSSAPSPAAGRGFIWLPTCAGTWSSTPVCGSSRARRAGNPSSARTTWRCTGGRTPGRPPCSARSAGTAAASVPP